MTGLILMLLTAPSHTDAPIPVNPRLPATIATRPLPVPPVCGMDAGSALGWDGGQFYCAPASSGASFPTPPVCNDGGVALSWDGGSFGCTPIATSAASWHVAYNCEFWDAGTVALDAGNGQYTVCGFPLHAINQANTWQYWDAGYGTDVWPGVGLRVWPAQNTQWWPGTTYNAPVYFIYASEVSSRIGPFTPVRITAEGIGYDQGQTPENGHQMRVGINTDVTPDVYGSAPGLCSQHMARLNGVSYKGFIWANFIVGGGAGGAPQSQWPPVAGKLGVGALWFPQGIGSIPLVAGGDDAGAMTAGGASNPAQYLNSCGFPGGPGTARFFISAESGGSANVVQEVLGRLQIEYWE